MLPAFWTFNQRNVNATNSVFAKVLPKSLIGPAFWYVFAHWDDLGHYMYEGRLPIDNNWWKMWSGLSQSEVKIFCSPVATNAGEFSVVLEISTN
ncbi:hypothetical protein GCM10007423_01560 [Dyadobacter endophyticus]|uniref:Uncharacterized protein n=1 Tax=Dyadobacter endophyticus TaxID=1749036 RepID=A0ABQ1YCB6_9BACT|nr:hypothetical protein GCM10007423_01560 [Dyadobacter endophyticus]